MDSAKCKEHLVKEGFLVINDVFSEKQADDLLEIISSADSSGPEFRKTPDLFASRRFFEACPIAAQLVFTEKFKAISSGYFGSDFFVVKSIYFDKPASSNWFVAWHQDLTISVDRKLELEGFGPWTRKELQFAVQPPLEILEDNFTIRIHLDDTREENGALKIVPGSHLKGVLRPETIDWSSESVVSVNVGKGGVMIMKPLLMHASGRTTNQAQRRVLHIEFSRSRLPEGLCWAEKMVIAPA
ncbi:MAG: phytanoyl-CoA dioxygenase family protein [Chitinophagaceae bacterium]